MSNRTRGVALLEMLLVITMTALVMLAMGSALRTMAQTEDRVGQRIQRNDQMRTTFQFLQQILGQVDMSKVPDMQLPGVQHIRFAARSGVIEWVGLMSARHGAAGRFFFRLAREEGERGADLVLRIAPVEAQAAFPDWALSEKHVLVRNVVDFGVEAKGAALGPGPVAAGDGLSWKGEWTSATDIPQQVRLRLSDRQGAWPPMVIPMFAMVQSQSGRGGFVAGGSK